MIGGYCEMVIVRVVWMDACCGWLAGSRNEPFQGRQLVDNSQPVDMKW